MLAHTSTMLLSDYFSSMTLSAMIANLHNRAPLSLNYISVSSPLAAQFPSCSVTFTHCELQRRRIYNQKAIIIKDRTKIGTLTNTVFLVSHHICVGTDSTVRLGTDIAPVLSHSSNMTLKMKLMICKFLILPLCQQWRWKPLFFHFGSLRNEPSGYFYILNYPAIL